MVIYDWATVVLILAQRLRGWPSIETTYGEASELTLTKCCLKAGTPYAMLVRHQGKPYLTSSVFFSMLGMLGGKNPQIFTRCFSNAGHRLSRWPNNKPTLVPFC